MARIRTIKPELPQSQSIGRLSREARLLFIQLFTVADDAGRARAASRLLASLLYPYDDDAPVLIGGWLEELEREKQIRRYEVDGSEYLEIVKWLEHQKIDRPSQSRLPGYREESSTTRDVSRDLDADLGPVPVPVPVPHTPAAAEGRPSARDWFDEFWQAYPERDGDNPRLPAKLKFDALVKTGVDPELMIAGAKRYADKAREKQQIGTQYIAHALKWLSDQRWADIAAVAYVAAERSDQPNEKDWDAAVKRWLKNESLWPRWAGSSPGSSACRCPAEVLIANGVDPDSGGLISRMVPIIAGTEEMAALVSYRQSVKIRPPKVYEVETDGRVQTLCWSETRWPKGFNDFGERIAPTEEENVA